jgi:3'-phosphoadenosine 5'-phosphosulfate sulfotransferase (PAPS reductase)/FAD synthetase
MKADQQVLPIQEDAKQHNIVSVSGGKDSTALLAVAVAREVPNLEAVFADTGHEHALTYEYIHYLSDWLQNQGHKPIRWIKADFSDDLQRRRAYLLRVAAGEIEDRFGKRRHTQETAARAAEVMHPTGSAFLDLAILKGRFPSTRRRFCSEELKRNPIIEQVFIPLLNGRCMVLSWQGVRADESQARRGLPECDEVGGGLFNYRPILRWTVEDVFEAHRTMGLKPNPLYRMGMGRVGCMPCIHCRKDELLNIAQRFPEVIDRVETMEQQVRLASKRGMSTFFAIADNKGTGIREVVEWGKTSRGGKQYDLFRVLADEPVCTSIYGLCE